MDLLLLIIFLILFYYSVKYYKSDNQNSLSLSGPTPIPILGNIHQVGKDAHLTIPIISKKYHGIFRMWLGGTYYVVVSDYKLIREMYIEKFENFKDRIETFKTMTGDDTGGIIGCNGDSWDCNKELIMKSYKKLLNKDINYFILLKSKELLNFFEKNGIKNEDGNDDDVDDGNKSIIINNTRFYFQSLTLSVMFKMIFNENKSFQLYSNSTEFKLIFKTIYNLLNSLNVYNVIYDFLGIFQPILLKFTKILDKNSFLSKIATEKFNSRIKEIDFTRDNFKANDLLDSLIMTINEDENGLNERQIENIKSICIDFLMAGTDTTGSTIEWIVLKLINNPEYQELIFQELKKLNKSEINANDKINTPFLNSFIKETNRLYPIAPLSLPRKSINEMIIGDNKYYIPANTNILMDVKGFSLDENNYKDPNEFKPDRFLNSKVSDTLNFGIGPRNCIGQTIAMNQIHIFLSNLILNYRMYSINCLPLPENQILSVSVRPTEYSLKLIKRV
ncbi:hypothetical protein ACTFIW_007293 [Dictyostelium discoideum]